MMDAKQLRFTQLVSALAFQSPPSDEAGVTAFGVSLFGLSTDGVAYTAVWDHAGDDGRILGWKQLSMSEVDEDGAPIMVEMQEEP